MTNSVQRLNRLRRLFASLPFQQLELSERRLMLSLLEGVIADRIYMLDLSDVAPIAAELNVTEAHVRALWPEIQRFFFVEETGALRVLERPDGVPLIL